MHVGARDHVLGVLNEILVARRVSCVLRGRSNVLLILISLDILGERRLVLSVREEASRAAVFEVILVAALLVWVLPGRGVRNLLREQGHVVLSSVFVVLDLGHLIGTHLRLCLPSVIRTSTGSRDGLCAVALVCRYLTII